MEQLYWNIENFSGAVINLLDSQENRLYSDKLTMRQVEQFLGIKLRIAKEYDYNQIICSPYVIVNGVKYLDCRKSKRGKLRHYYVQIN